MAENYNLGSKFGFNVTGQNKSAVVQKKVNPEALGEMLFGKRTNYIDKYENVFDGSVADEINMYSRQAMIVGMNLKASDTRHKFDMNI